MEAASYLRLFSSLLSLPSATLTNKQFRKLSAKSNHIGVEVVRGDRRQSMSTFDVVVGDIVCLKIGDQVSADGVFLEGHSLKANESSMKGESEHVHVNGEKNPFLLSGRLAQRSLMVLHACLLLLWE